MPLDIYERAYNFIICWFYYKANTSRRSEHMSMYRLNTTWIVYVSRTLSRLTYLYMIYRAILVLYMIYRAILVLYMIYIGPYTCVVYDI